MYECGTCGKCFNAAPDKGYTARKNHCSATGHIPFDFVCDTCGAEFGSEQACEQHKDAKGHWLSSSEEGECSSDDSDSNDGCWPCEICDADFNTEDACCDHEVEFHFYCYECNQKFSTYDGIRNHLESNAHTGCTVKCPLCSFSEENAAAVTRHVEGGRCPGAPQLNRDTLYNLVRSKDPDSRLSRKSIFGDRGTAAGVRYEADEKAWNPKQRGYECCFCHTIVNTLKGLNYHLNSDIHQESLYHCPARNCRREFKSLAAAVQHLELRGCGAMRPKNVEKLLGQILSGNGPIRC